MRTITHVQFDRAEREVLIRAFNHIRIAFPDAPDKGTSEWRECDIRHLSIAQKGESMTLARIEGAERALMLLRDACKEQSEVDYWLRARGIPDIDSAAGADMCEVLAEAREQQCDHAVEALGVVRRAGVLLRDAEVGQPEWEDDEAVLA